MLLIISFIVCNSHSVNLHMHFRLLNKLIPDCIKRINTKGGKFALMENLEAVQKAMRQYGLPEDELFQPVDLFEARNIRAVVKSLAALARLVSHQPQRLLTLHELNGMHCSCSRSLSGTTQMK